MYPKPPEHRDSIRSWTCSATKETLAIVSALTITWLSALNVGRGLHLRLDEVYAGVRHRLHQIPHYLKSGSSRWMTVWASGMTLEQAGQLEADMNQNVTTMNKRCSVVEQLGGTIYADPRGCTDMNRIEIAAGLR
ncbi:hypothetical protein BR93DRAFT_272045 [Coniochaeta sp. PMI_546]|nr:hypothetical protein BR93DRAFT_272045 [Coniochaeta sp. PMI_546]